MELDNLKTIWKEQDIPLGDDQHNAELLASMLQERSRGPIERMRRNVRLESLLMFVTYIPTIVLYLTFFQGKLWGISLMMGFQAMVSIGVNLGVLPTKGLTLPLISSGGSSVLMTCAMVGVLLRATFEINRAEDARQTAVRLPANAVPDSAAPLGGMA